MDAESLSPGTGSATDVLIRALERADEMENIVVLWIGKGDDGAGGMIANVDIPRATFLVEAHKIAWLSAYKGHFE